MIEVDKLNPEGNTLTSKRINENINVPEDKREAYERVVLAGKKMMFDKRTNKLMLEAIQGEGSLGMRLGKGIATLILLLFRESQQTIPPSVIVPAGVNLVGEAADFLQKANIEKVNDAIVAEAIQIFVEAIIQSFGGDTNRMYALFEQFEQQKGGQQQTSQPMGGQS